MLLFGLFGNLTGLELRAEEPRRAVVSLEMAITGEMIVPHINGVEYYNKPPVFNWVMMAFMKIFKHSSEWVVRLPSLISLLLLAFINFRFVSSKLSKEVAIASSLALLTAADLLFYGSVNAGEIDLFYALIVYLQFISIYHFEQKKEWLKLFFVSYLLTAVGFLTKGMPSLAFQAFTLSSWFLYTKQFRHLFSWQHLLGTVGLVAPVGGYFTLYAQKADWQVFLVRQFKEASQRTAAESVFSDVILQIFSFPVQYLVLILPWAFLIVLMVKKGTLTHIRSQRIINFLAIIFLFNIILYWFAGEFKARYYYMFLPVSLVILFSFYYRKDQDQRIMRILHMIFKVVGVICMAGIFAGAFYMIKEISAFKATVLVISIIASALLIMVLFKTELKVLGLVGLLAILRIVFNYSYIPEIQKSNDGLSYRDEVSSVLQITQNDQVFLYGDAYNFSSDASIGPIKLKEVELTTAPLLAYQIPYYISSANGHVVEFDPSLQAERWYLVPQEKMKGLEAYKNCSLRDRWMNKNYYLVSTHSPTFLETGDNIPQE